MTSKRTAWLVSLVALPAALSLGSTAPAQADQHPGKTYHINLKHLNDSGASATALLSLTGTRLTVQVEGKGLAPNQPHAQHIHGSTEGIDRHCPDASADKNGDGIVTTSEGVPIYGEVNIALTTRGDTSKKSTLAVDRMPKADSRGNLSYRRTLHVSHKVAAHLKDLHMVQHGVDFNSNKKYDFGKGKSDLDPKLPQEATAPASCGILHGAAIGSMPVGGVETGGGMTDGAGAASPTLLASGGAALLGAAGVLTAAWHRSRRGR